MLKIKQKPEGKTPSDFCFMKRVIFRICALFARANISQRFSIKQRPINIYYIGFFHLFYGVGGTSARKGVFSHFVNAFKEIILVYAIFLKDWDFEGIAKLAQRV